MRPCKTEVYLSNNLIRSFDKAGNNTKVTDPEGNITTNTYDVKSRLTKTLNTVDGKAVETLYTYDAFSNLTKVTDPMGNDIQSTYDELGRVIQNTDSLGKTEKTKYDVMGNPVQTIARSEIVTTYEYNSRGWLTKSTTGSIITEMTYDKAGRVTRKNRGDDIRLYEYYANGQLKKETAEDGKPIQYVYDALGRRTQMTDYFGQVFTYSYNNRDYLIGVSGLGKSVSYTRNPDGTVATKTMGNLAHSYHYDSLNQLTGLTHTANSNTLQTYAYTYDLNGNQLTKNRTKDGSTTTETYTYDVLNRVKTVSAGGSTTTYSYDKNGNILSESTANGENTAVTSYTYDANNRLIHKSAGTSFWEFSYDHDGNLIYKAQGTTAPGEGEETPAIFVLGTDTAEAFGDTATYQYNVLGQLAQYLDLNGQTVTYTYDLNGLRSSKTVNGVTTKYYYDGDLVVNETDGTNLTATNLNGVQTEMRFAHEGETITAAYFLYDGHGDVVSVRDETLDEIANYEYDIYGEEKSSTGTYDSPIRYTGQYYDAETGMYYLRARFYDPAIRRFISEDSYWNVDNRIFGDKMKNRIPDWKAIRQSGNLYAYCAGNPVNYYDYSGNFALSLGIELIYVPAVIYLMYNVGEQIVSTTKDAVDSWKYEKALEKAQSIADAIATVKSRTDDQNPTVIYRMGSGNGTNLTPREADIDGLSYTTIMPSGSFTVTTMSAINATGKLMAVMDPKNKTHILVLPVDQTKMQEWQESRPFANIFPHEFTKILQEISIKIK